jgi:UDP-N-acetylglucosamine acyltransferase
MKTSQLTIHETAIVDPMAEIGFGVEIGPYCVIGPNVRIGDGTLLSSHVTIQPYTTIGSNCRIQTGAVLGGPPQDTKFHDEISYVAIGDNNVIREYVTIHRASGEGCATRIGDNNMLMAYCHIGHNSQVGSGITMANYVGISGHVTIEDKVVIGGIVGVHQFVRIGRLAMVGGYSKVVQDVPPFSMADGRPAKVCDLNVVGLRRNGVSAKIRADLRRAFKLLYRSNLNLSQAVECLKLEVDPSPEMEYLVEFIKNVKNGFGGRQLDRPRR